MKSRQSWTSTTTHSPTPKLFESGESKPHWQRKRLEIGPAPVSTNKSTYLSFTYYLFQHAKIWQVLTIFVVKKINCSWAVYESPGIHRIFQPLTPDNPSSGAPGGPTNNAPLGILAPSSEYLLPQDPRNLGPQNDTKIFTTGGHEISHQPQNNLCTDSLKEIYGTSTKLPYICIVSSPWNG